MGSFDCALAVIGGGSGGMALAKRAAAYGQKVILFDFVKPSTQGAQWGLGGTCVNVGCIPKKLMHHAAQMSSLIHADAAAFGLALEQKTHSWPAMVSTIQNYIKSLNFSYRNGLRSKGVTYINAAAKFAGPNKLVYMLNGVEHELTAETIVIATGGRPQIPDDVEGARELAITSDDLFSLKKAPGKTLCVGASYISLECAGFLHELGYDATVAMRSIPLRGFDRQCSEKVVSLMAAAGLKFYRPVVPTKLEKTDDNRILVTLSDSSTDPAKTRQEVFDTVLYAVGRRADTHLLGLDTVGVKVDHLGKIVTDKEEMSSVPGIYALGDCAKNRPELTPVAIQAGEYLADRLFAKSTRLMDYNLIPTTVFTPFEYGCIGYSEEDAEAVYGKENIETYLFEFSTLAASAAHREIHPSTVTDEYDTAFPPTNLSKLVCLKTENERVIGYHFVGPNAGEATQGYAVAMRCGATKKHFDETVGIHPTDAESFHDMTITRASGEDFVASGGCGGGKCG